MQKSRVGLLAIFLTFGSLCLNPGLSWGFRHTTFVTSANYNSPAPADSNFGGLTYPGFGLLFEWMFSRRSGVEIGMLYEPQVLNDLVSDNFVFPLMYRYWFTQHYTFSLGGYYTNQFNVIPLFISPDNYGLRATVGVNINLSRKLALALEAGVQYGLANLSTAPGATFTKDQAFVTVGFRWGGVQKVTMVAKNGMKYYLDRPPEFEEASPVPQELLP